MGHGFEEVVDEWDMDLTRWLLEWDRDVTKLLLERDIDMVRWLLG